MDYKLLKRLFWRKQEIEILYQIILSRSNVNNSHLNEIHFNKSSVMFEEVYLSVVY